MLKKVLGVAVLVIITILIYLPAIKGGWIWDDPGFVRDNPIIHAQDGLKKFWMSTEPPDYFPLTSTTLWLEWRLWGDKATGYHVTNVLLHIISCLLLWLILVRLKIPGAWLISFLFAIHPVNVESVAWITQRKNVLPLVFYLLSILMYLKFEINEKKHLYWISVFSFVLALLSKTSVIMLPFVILGCVWWQQRKITLKDIKRSIPFFVVSFGLSFVTIWYQYNRSIGDDIVRTDGLISRTACAAWTVWFYLYKALFPLKLIFIYPRWEINTSLFITYVPGILLVGVFLFLWWNREKNWGRPLLFALGYFVVTLFPVMGFLNIYYFRYSLVADHYQYLSMISIIAVCVVFGYHLYEKVSKESHRRAILSFVVILATLYSMQTITMANTYKSAETIYYDILSKNKNCWMAYYNLGYTFQEREDYAKAIECYETALELDPTNADPYNNMGNVYLAKKNTNKAIECFRNALKIKPDLAETHYNLGTTLMEANRLDEAIQSFYTAIKFTPRNKKAHNNLANALATQGRYHQASMHYQKALQVDPDFVDVLTNYGIVLKLQKKYGKAAEMFYRALQLNPQNENAKKNLAYTIQMRDRV